MRIKVTGYLDSEDLPEEWIDEDSKAGLTEEAYDQAMDILISGQLGMHDVDIEVDDDA